MLSKLKRVLRIGQQPSTAVLLENVDAAKPDPEQKKQVDSAVARLVGSLIELERHSYEVRRELATLTLNVVNRKK